MCIRNHCVVHVCHPLWETDLPHGVLPEVMRWALERIPDMWLFPAGRVSGQNTGGPGRGQLDINDDQKKKKKWGFRYVCAIFEIYVE